MLGQDPLPLLTTSLTSSRSLILLASSNLSDVLNWRERKPESSRVCMSWEQKELFGKKGEPVRAGEERAGEQSTVACMYKNVTTELVSLDTNQNIFLNVWSIFRKQLCRGFKYWAVGSWSGCLLCLGIYVAETLMHTSSMKPPFHSMT